jgi:hypothetical protein
MEFPIGTGGGNPETRFRGEKRSNATHASTTDPDARLYRKGPGMEARLCFLGHALMENRSGVGTAGTSIAKPRPKLKSLPSVLHSGDPRIGRYGNQIHAGRGR